MAPKDVTAELATTSVDPHPVSANDAANTKTLLNITLFFIELPPELDFRQESKAHIG